MTDNITSSLPPLYHHPHHGHKTAYVTATLVGLLLPHAVCTVIVLARMLARPLISQQWHIDDTLVVAAWLCSTAVCVVYSMSVLGPNESLLDDFLLNTNVGLVCYQLSLCLTQLSILSLYLRVVPNRRLVWTAIAAVLASSIPLLWMSIMQCSPAASPPQFFGKPVAICFAFRPLLIASTSLYVAAYAWLVILAAPMVFGRGAPPRPMRWALLGVLGLSVFVVAADLSRLLLGLHSHKGRTFFIMTVLECDTAIICASAVPLKPLLVRIKSRLGLGNDNDNNNNNNNNNNTAFAGSAPRDGDSTARHSIFHPRISIYNLRQRGDSGDLSSVVSYHGYPWTQNHVPARSKPDVVVTASNHAFSGALANDNTTSQTTVIAPLQQPPLSLNTLQSAATSDPPSGTLTRRPSSTFFEAAEDFAQYFPECTPPPKSTAKSSTKSKSAAIGLGISLALCGEKRKSTGSEESFVMGLNDPASPTRLTRLTRVSGYSGETYTGGGCEDDELRMKSKGDDYTGKTEGRAPKSRKNMETSFFDDTDSEGDAEAEAAEAAEAAERNEMKSKKDQV